MKAEEFTNQVDELSRAYGDLQDLMTATGIRALLLDRALRVRRFTPRAADLFEISALDQGRPLEELKHRLRYPGFVQDARRVLERLEPVEREVQGLDGLWFLVRLQPHRTAGDEVDGVVLTFVEVSRRSKRGEQLHQEDKSYRLLLQNVTEYAILVTDTARRIVAWNKGAEQMFGYTEAEVVGASADVIFTPEDQAAGAPGQEAAQAVAEGQAADERWHVHQDGRRFWGSGVMVALREEDGTLYGFAKILRDVTRRRQAEAQLQELNETLEKRVQERTAQVRALAADLALVEQRERRRISQILHDHLQQILYGVRIKAEIAEQQAASAEQGALADQVAELGRLVDEAIQVTRTLTVELSPPVLREEGLMAALQWLAVQMEEVHGLQVDIEAGEQADVVAEDIRVLLFQLIRELLFNVVKHAGVDRARVTLHGAADQLEITVEDQGNGFDVQAVLSGKRLGGRLGLFSVRERVDLIGGRLEIRSGPGRGTRAQITVPL